MTESAQSSRSLKYVSPIPVGGPSKSSEPTVAAAVEDIISRPNPSDPVVNPNHYQGKGGLEAIEVIRAFDLDKSFELGNAAKYLLRAGKKDDMVQDIRKARQNLDMWLAYHQDEKE